MLPFLYKKRAPKGARRVVLNKRKLHLKGKIKWSVPREVGGGGRFRDRPMMVILGEDPSNTCRLSRRVRMLYPTLYTLSTL